MTLRVFTATIEQFPLHSSIHYCYHSAVPTTLKHSLLPFGIPHYTPSIHCYHWAVPTTLKHSLLPFGIPHYTPASTAPNENFLLHSSIHCYFSEFPTTLEWMLGCSRNSGCIVFDCYYLLIEISANSRLTVARKKGGTRSSSIWEWS